MAERWVAVRQSKIFMIACSCSWCCWCSCLLRLDAKIEPTATAGRAIPSFSIMSRNCSQRVFREEPVATRQLLRMFGVTELGMAVLGGGATECLLRLDAKIEPTATAGTVISSFSIMSRNCSQRVFREELVATWQLLRTADAPVSKTALRHASTARTRCGHQLRRIKTWRTHKALFQTLSESSLGSVAGDLTLVARAEGFRLHGC